MKRIFALILCLMLVCVPIVASAEDYEVGDVFEGEVDEGNSTPEEETPTEEEILPPVETPEEPADPPVETPPAETPEETPEADESIKDTVMEGLEEADKDEIEAMADKIVKYVEAHLDTISLFFTVIISIFYQIKKHASLNKTIGVLNNNSITVAENSATAINNVMAKVEEFVLVVTGYKEKTAELLEAYKQTAEDNKALQARLVEFETYLKNSKKANVEFSNTLAELLVLSNIPNSKKEELYARHRAAVELLDTAEVTEDEGNKE